MPLSHRPRDMQVFYFKKVNEKNIYNDLSIKIIFFNSCSGSLKANNVLFQNE